MFLFLYTKRLRCLLRDRDSVFWTMLFPLLLATLFHIAFGNILKQEEGFSPVATAVVNNNGYQSNTAFREALKAVSTGQNRLLDLTVLSDKEAAQKLSKGEIAGVITVSDNISLEVRGSGINQSLIKAFLDEYIQMEKTVGAILAENPSTAGHELFHSLADRKNYTKELSLSDSYPDMMLNYFFALIAMSCLYGCFWGLRNTTDIQADLSALGARRSVAPTHKLMSVMCDQLAAFTIHFAEILIALLYIVFVLGVDFGERWALMLLTCFVGSVTGVSYGTFIGSAFKKNENLKYGVLIGITMFLTFLAGLMFADMKYVVARHAPVLSYINPAALITDAFYSLYVYQSLDRYFLNIGILSIISVVFALGSFLIIRRQRYASI